MEQKELTFSIIVPTFSRARQLADCLEALSRLNYSRDCFEVIVVDDGSETPPEDVVSSFRDRLDVFLHSQPHGGPASARNSGAARAKGEFLAFTDDDCAPASDWLKNLAERLRSRPDHAIGGRTVNAFPKNPYSNTSQAIIDVVYAYYNADPNRARFFASNNLTLPANRFRAMGGFDSTFVMAAGEDRDLCDRWLHHGYQMTYAPEAIVYHVHELTLATFWRQHFNYGRGAFRFHRARAWRGSGRFRPELRFYLSLLRFPFLQAGGLRSLLLTATILLSQVANAAGVCLEAEESFALPTLGWHSQ